MIHVENRSLCYFLSAKPLIHQEPTLMLWLHRNVVEGESLGDFSDHKRIQRFASENQTAPFQGSLTPGSSFGFGGALSVGEWSHDFLPLMIPIPSCEEEVSVCRMCEGTPQGENHCFFCNGSGKKEEFDGEPLWPVVTSLALLFDRMYYCEALFGKRSSPAEPHFQMITVEVFADRERSVFGMHGMYSIPLITWLAKFPQATHLKPLTDAMTRVERRIFPMSFRNDIDDNRAVAEQNGWLNISCRGQACGLHPHHSGIHPGQGVEFLSHNIDYLAQELILLAALGALTDMAMEAKAGGRT